MICLKCNNVINENTAICPNCGNNLLVQNQNSNEGLNNENINSSLSSSNGNNKKNSNKVLIIVSILVCILLFLFVNKIINKNGINSGDDEFEKEFNESVNNIGNFYSFGKVDENINLEYDENGAFLMGISSVFELGDDFCVSGVISRGTVKTGDKVYLMGSNKKEKSFIVDEILGYRKVVDSAKIGDEVTFKIKGIGASKITIGQVLADRNSILTSTRFDADIKVIGSGINKNDLLSFRFWDESFLGKVILPNGLEKLDENDEIFVTVDLETNVALEVGMEFYIFSGGLTKAMGKITKVYVSEEE